MPKLYEYFGIVILFHYDFLIPRPLAAGSFIPTSTSQFMYMACTKGKKAKRKLLLKMVK